jgi:hypothetical protein
MSAWSHLPNAVHIDRVLALIKSHPKLWDQAWSQVWNQAFDQVWHQAWYQVRDQAFMSAWYQASDQASSQASDQASDQAAAPLLALIAYDDCAKYLKLSIDQLQMLYHLTEHPACLLLQPAVIAFELETELA